MTDAPRISEQQFQKAIDRLSTLISYRTIAADAESPIDACVSFLERELHGLGADVEVLRLPGARPLLFAEIKGRADSSLMFYQHYDVQPAGTLANWDSDPFVLNARDGVLYGRGIADNKGNLAARIAALEVLLTQYGELPITVRFLIEGEEEIGSPNLPVYLHTYDSRLRADACIWEGGYRDAEGRFVVTLGIKGMCRLTLTARGPERDLHGKFAPLTRNPATRLAAAIHCLLDEDGHVRVPGFYDSVIPPTVRELEWIEAAAPELENLRHETGLGIMTAATGEEALKRLVFLSTGNVEGLAAGEVGAEARSIVPAKASANISFRLVPDQKPEIIADTVSNFLRDQGFDDLAIHYVYGVPPARTPDTHPLVTAVLTAVEALEGEPPAVWPMSPGTGPMATVCHSRGMAAVALGVGHAGSNTHGPNENIRLADYRLGIDIMARVLQTLGAGTDER